MAKLKAPLMSLGATGALGKSIVFFGWKGLNVAREYVVPSNPQSGPQTTQRGYLTEAVTLIHTAQADPTNPLGEVDKQAYALWGSIFATPRTWFNQACKNCIDLQTAAKKGIIYHKGVSTPGAGQIGITLKRTKQGANDITVGLIYYGTSKSAMLNSISATIVAGAISGTITGLTAGVKYFWQFKPSVHADFNGSASGIYYSTPT